MINSTMTAEEAAHQYKLTIDQGQRELGNLVQAPVIDVEANKDGES
jgi:hypothetical protein